LYASVISAKSCGVGIRVDVAYRSGFVISSCVPSARTVTEIGTIRRTRSG
jgi:hypothetical protein